MVRVRRLSPSSPSSRNLLGEAGTLTPGWTGVGSTETEGGQESFEPLRVPIHARGWPRDWDPATLFRGPRISETLMDVNLEKATRAKQQQWPLSSSLAP